MADLVEIGFVADVGGIRNAERGLDNLAVAGGRADSAMSAATSTARLLGSVLAAIGVSAGTQELIQYSDQWKNVNSQLRQVTETEKELVKVRNELLGLSKATRTSLSDTVSLYSNITRATSDLGLAQGEVVGITKTINNLFVAGGKSGQAAAAGILQLSQAFAAGVLRGDEFNSVAENAPRIMDALVQYTGMGRGALREFAAEGGITAEILTNALKQYESEAQLLADATEKTFGQSLIASKDNIMQFVGGAETLNGAINSLGSGLESFTEDLDAFTKAAGAVGVVVLASLVPSMYRYTASLAAATAAQLTMGTTATVTRNALGMVSVQAATSTVAMNALGIATKVALGPIGLLIAAVGAGAAAFSYFSDGAGGAASAAAALGGEIEDVKEKYLQLGDAQRQLARAGIVQQLDDQAEAVRKLKVAIAAESGGRTIGGMGQTAFGNVDSGAVLELRGRLEEAEKQAEKLKSKLYEIDGVDFPTDKSKEFLDSLTNVNNLLGVMPSSFSMVKESAWSMFEASAYGAERNSEAYTKMLAAIEKKIALHGNESEAAELAYDAGIGAIKGLTDAEAAHLVARQKTLESIEAQAEKQKEVNDQIKAMQQIVADWDVEAIGFEDNPFSENAEEIAAMDAEFQNYIDSIDEFGGAWTRTGSAVVDAVGSIVDVFDDYEARLFAIGKAEEENAKSKAETFDPEELKKLNDVDIKLAQERTKANLASYRSIAGAASQMFSEGSKGRKALHAVEKTLAAVELAMAIKNTATELALSATRTAAATAETGVNVAAGGSKMFAQSGWGGFAGVAAMVAVMAALGFSGGGGGGGASAADIQESQGTGSVLGSNEKSDSLQKSFDAFSDIAFDQLVELRGIRESLASFQGGIAQLAVGFSTSALSEQKYINFADTHLGVPLESGSFATTGSRSQDFDTRQRLAPFQSQLVEIFNFIGDSTGEAIKSLGLSTQESINSFYLQIGKVSFEGLSGEEIQQELNAIFSQQADLITGHLVPAMSEYQKMGEGLFETLTRVAMEQAIFNDTMDSMGISLADMSSLMKIDVAQSIIGMIGGIEKFNEAASSYIDNFFSEEEKFGMLAKTISETFAALGQEVPTTRDAFRDMIEAIDPADEAQQRLLASLLEMNPAVDEYLSAIEDQKAEELKIAESAAAEQLKIADDAAKYAEQVSKNKYSLEIDLLKAQGKTAEALLLEQQRTLDGLDESLRPLQQSIWDTIAATKAQEDANKLLAQSHDLQVELLRAQGNEEQAIYLEREKILAALDESLRPLQKEIWETVAANSALADSMAQAEQAIRDADSAAYDSMIKGLNDQQQAVNQSMSNAEALLRRSFAAERERLTAVDNERLAAIDLNAASEIEAINAVQSAKMEAIAESNALQLSGLEAMKNAASAMSSDLRGLASSLFSAADSFGAQMIDRGAAFASLSSALSAARSGDFSKALSLGGSVDALKSMSETDFSSAADFNIAQARAQYALNALANLSSNQATVQDEIVLSLQAQIDVAKVYGQAQLDAQKQYGGALVAAVNYQAESQKADNVYQVEALDAMLDQLLGVDNSVVSLEDAITQFKQAQDAVAAFDYDAEVEKLDLARNQLGELQRINENLANQNIMAQQQNDLAAEVIKLRETMTEMQKDANDKLAGIARSTSASAQSLQNQEFSSEVA